MKKRLFTLVEIIATVVIIATLAAIAAPALMERIETSYGAKCTEQLRLIKSAKWQHLLENPGNNANGTVIAGGDLAERTELLPFFDGDGFPKEPTTGQQDDYVIGIYNDFPTCLNDEVNRNGLHDLYGFDKFADGSGGDGSGGDGSGGDGSGGDGSGGDGSGGDGSGGDGSGGDGSGGDGSGGDGSGGDGSGGDGSGDPGWIDTASRSFSPSGFAFGMALPSAELSEEIYNQSFSGEVAQNFTPMGHLNNTITGVGYGEIFTYPAGTSAVFISTEAIHTANGIETADEDPGPDVKSAWKITFADGSEEVVHLSGDDVSEERYAEQFIMISSSDWGGREIRSTQARYEMPEGHQIESAFTMVESSQFAEDTSSFDSWSTVLRPE